MKSCLYFFMVGFYFWCGQFASSQDKEVIVEKGIKVVRIYEQHLDDGDSEFWIDEEKFYNEKGDLIEYKEYADKGDDVKVWEKYRFDDEANLVEKIELSEDGKQLKRIVYIFENGLNTERWYYDDRDRLYQKKKFAYEF